MLDKVQIAAMRLADCVAFHTHVATPADIFAAPDLGSIRCTKRREPNASDPFAPSESVVEFPVFAALVNYERETGTHSRAAYKAFAMEHTPRGSDTWQTIVALLRAGDELTLQWSAGALTSPFLAERDIVGDTLHLIVKRGAKRMTFLLETSIGARRNRAVQVTTQYALA